MLLGISIVSAGIVGLLFVAVSIARR